MQQCVRFQATLGARFNRLNWFTTDLLKCRYDLVGNVSGAVVPSSMTRPVSRLGIVKLVDQINYRLTFQDHHAPTTTSRVGLPVY
jgi:hypothetical protein